MQTQTKVSAATASEPHLSSTLRSFLLFLSGAALTLAFPEPDLAPVAWVAITPLLWFTYGAGPRRSAWYGFVYGLGFFGVLVIWVKFVGWVPWGTVTVLQAAFFALLGALWGLLWRLHWLAATLYAAAAWVIVEFLRQELPVVGFTWGQLAQSQHNVSWILKLAGLTGGWGIASLIVTVNALLVFAFRQNRPRARIALPVVAAGLIAAPALIPAGTGTAGEPLSVAIVQGNVPRSFSGTVTEKNIQIINSHALLTRELAGQDVDLIVWPESSVGLDMERVPIVRDAVEGAAVAAGTELIVGGNEDAGPGYKVQAYHLAPSGEVIDKYQKTHLVPFGEYVPWRGVLGWIPMLDQVPRDAIPGRTPKIFRTQHGPVAPVISFEGDFGSLVRERIGETGGRLLVVATNTSTWASSWASSQHLAFSQVRAAENGVFVVHGALSGISAFIDPTGAVLQRSGLWTTETLIEDAIYFADEPTFYARTGDWFVWACAIGLVLALVAVKRRTTGTVP